MAKIGKDGLSREFDFSSVLIYVVEDDIAFSSPSTCPMPGSSFILGYVCYRDAY